MTEIDELRIILRESDVPFFSDEELAYYIKSEKTLSQAAYRCLLLKAENTSLSVSGLSCADTSRYFLRLAQKYRKNNSGTLKGG